MQIPEILYDTIFEKYTSIFKEISYLDIERQIDDLAKSLFSIHFRNNN